MFRCKECGGDKIAQGYQRTTVWWEDVNKTVDVKLSYKDEFARLNANSFEDDEELEEGMYCFKCQDEVEGKDVGALYDEEGDMIKLDYDNYWGKLKDYGPGLIVKVNEYCNEILDDGEVYSYGSYDVLWNDMVVEVVMDDNLDYVIVKYNDE